MENQQVTISSREKVIAELETFMGNLISQHSSLAQQVAAAKEDLKRESLRHGLIQTKNGSLEEEITMKAKEKQALLDEQNAYGVSFSDKSEELKSYIELLAGDCSSVGFSELLEIAEQSKKLLDPFSKQVHRENSKDASSMTDELLLSEPSELGWWKALYAEIAQVEEKIAQFSDDEFESAIESFDEDTNICEFDRVISSI